MNGNGSMSVAILVQLSASDFTSKEIQYQGLFGVLSAAFRVFRHHDTAIFLSCLELLENHWILRKDTYFTNADTNDRYLTCILGRSIKYLDHGMESNSSFGILTPPQEQLTPDS